jgi:hypothetical protein
MRLEVFATHQGLKSYVPLTWGVSKGGPLGAHRPDPTPFGAGTRPGPLPGGQGPRRPLKTPLQRLVMFNPNQRRKIRARSSGRTGFDR